ncbi:MAG: hypothetical protein CMP02_06555 [Woeseiaceae bacterium]|nr:hypothetical protein [Woeseiaceae bacterium]
MSHTTISDYHSKAIYDYGLADIWPEKVLIESKVIEDKFIESSHELEKFPFITIDGEDAKDFDDAIYCLATNDGFHLKVAIADVSHYVKTESAIDKEASKRTTSVYFPQKVVPMLPENLSNELCSLKPNKRRRVLCVEIDFDKDGIINKYQFKRGIIKSSARLTYSQVEKFYAEKYQDLEGPYVDSLKSSFHLCKKLLAQRQIRGALDFEISEPAIILDKEKKIKSLHQRRRLFSHKLIEELMLAANIVAADFIEKNFDNGIYRVHETPESIKIDRLSQTLKRRGINWHGNIEDIENLSNFLKKMSSRKDASILNTLVLQSMQRAEYKTKNKGHFGLKFDKYTHFTSPIRRYPDLLVHRMIISILNKEKINAESLEEVLDYCSQKEKDAEFASKQVIQNLLCEYVKNFRNKNFSGFITGVKDFGLFVDIPDLFTSGLLHVNDLPNDFYRYNARNQTLDGKRRGNKFSLGDEIKVYIGDIKELEGKISLYY